MKKPSPTLLGNTEGTALSSGRAWLREATLQRAGEGSLGVPFRGPAATQGCSRAGGGGAGDSVLVPAPAYTCWVALGKVTGRPCRLFCIRREGVDRLPVAPGAPRLPGADGSGGGRGPRQQRRGKRERAGAGHVEGAGARGGGAWRAPLRWWRGGREGAGPRAGPPWGEAGGREGRSGDGGGGGSGGRGRGAPGS